VLHKESSAEEQATTGLGENKHPGTSTVAHPAGKQLGRKGFGVLVDTKLTMSQQCAVALSVKLLSGNKNFFFSL